MNNDQLIQIFRAILAFMICILIILFSILIYLKLKKDTSNKKKNLGEKANKQVKNTESSTLKSYNKQSIFKFIDFDKIQDNMIVQKDGKRFLMVIECQGINYDLMSGLEKNSVEQGFLQFLNTLRYPIQIYVQTRTVNLSGSIDSYKERMNEISKQFANKQIEYNQKVRSGQFTDKELAMEKYELAREQNLYEYGIDIINNTERMSLNKNILSKHYYVIIPYYSEETGTNNYDKEEIANIAFSELYTKAQTLINSLAVCGINSKVLNSMELTELLYVAYNRDESEIFNLKRAINAGYEDLYSTAPDVFEKRMKELDIKVEEEAIKKANEAVFRVVEENKRQKKAKEKEQNLDNLIDEFAKILLDENEQSLGKQLTEQSKQEIDKDIEKRTKEKEEKEDGQKTKKTTTRRKTTKSV